MDYRNARCTVLFQVLKTSIYKDTLKCVNIGDGNVNNKQNKEEEKLKTF